MYNNVTNNRQFNGFDIGTCEITVLYTEKKKFPCILFLVISKVLYIGVMVYCILQVVKMFIPFSSVTYYFYVCLYTQDTYVKRPLNEWTPYKMEFGFGYGKK